MNEIATGAVDSHVVAAILMLLRAKGETDEEVAGLASAMASHALRPATAADPATLLDIVGTGGDGHNTVNVSTTAAILAAAAGATVAKHGNVSVSSKSGSADVLRGVEVWGCGGVWCVTGARRPTPFSRSIVDGVFCHVWQFWASPC